jgi:arginyl-tRNA synthetase
MAMVRNLLESAFARAATLARDAHRLSFETLPAFTIEHPSNPVFGDFTCNLGMMLAGPAKVSPRQVAQILIDHLELPVELLQRVEITGPGFINLFLTRLWMHDLLREIHAAGDAYGHSNRGAGTPVLVEFVSANPNGPLSIAHGRGAVLGDVLCRVLDAVGYTVTREFYVNDAATSTQMVRFGESLVVRYLQVCGLDVEFPEDGYHGQYVIDFARDIVARDGDVYVKMPPAERLERFTAMGMDAMIAWQRAVLAGFGIEFESWFTESALYDSRAIEEALHGLAQRGETYETDGAIWLASTKYGDDKDRPLVRSNGKPTYLASDIAYHLNKFQRGFQMLIDVWGPEHHGYIARTKAAMAAHGYDLAQLHILIFQTVRLLRNNEFVMGGKREGDVILLTDLLEQVGKDAARIFFLLRGTDAELHIDLDLASRPAPENPAYFLQHAHARIAGILRTATEQGTPMPDPATADLAPLQDDAEIALMRRLADMPEEVLAAAELYEPHRLARYAQDLAREFHRFYERCPVLKPGTPPPARDARLVLVNAARITLRNVLALLGVEAPERM